MRRVVVTGIGAITPIGKTVSEYSQGLFSGISGADIITRFDPSLFKTKFACEVKDFNVTDYLDRKAAKRMDPFTHFAMIVAEEAMQQSGLDLEKINLDKAGVIWGSGIGGFKTIEEDLEGAYSTFINKNIIRYSPFLIPKLISDIAPGYISIKYGFRGINYATVSACASSTHAIGNAFDYIRWGKADVMICGGSEASITKAGVGGFSSMRAMSERNDDPKTASRPFDKDRDGFVLGEGGGGLILEEYEHAKARGANIIVEVAGSAMTADAHHITAPHPEGLGATNVMRLAIEDAKLNADEVDYVNVHGTSTPLGDVAESKAILKVFKESAYKLNISSTKSMTGHLLGAAGAVEAIACILAITNDKVPPTINHFNDDPVFDKNLNFTFNQTQERKVSAAISNTFGFGGHNASIIFKKFDG